MSLNCPNCGCELSLNLAVLSLNSEPHLGPVEPQLAPVEPQIEAAPVVGDVFDSKNLEPKTQPKTNTPPNRRARYAYSDEGFQAFWKAYPRHVGKAAAFGKWRIAVREVEPQILIEAAARYGSKVEAQQIEARFIPYPEKWLSQGRWEDEDDPAPKVDARYQPYDHEAHLRALEDL